ncbi:MAG: hypothetical protein M0P31_06770 [Solirubrobacteraceae bacterium]|nr:hypothetical protein [Solirubrobacteraceae bacterium]
MAASRSTKQRSTTGSGHWAGTARVVRAGGTSGATAGTKARSGAASTGGMAKGARRTRAAGPGAAASAGTAPSKSGAGRPRRRRDEDEATDESTTADRGPKECSPCRGKGRLQSNAGGEPHEVVCAWCDGTGVEIPGRDAQEHPAERPDPKPDAGDDA